MVISYLGQCSSLLVALLECSLSAANEAGHLVVANQRLYCTYFKKKAEDAD